VIIDKNEINLMAEMIREAGSEEQKVQ